MQVYFGWVNCHQSVSKAGRFDDLNLLLLDHHHDSVNLSKLMSVTELVSLA